MFQKLNMLKNETFQKMKHLKKEMKYVPKNETCFKQFNVLNPCA